MLEGTSVASGVERFKLLVVIVLYKQRPSESAAFSTLWTAISRSDRREADIKALLFDNTPDACEPGILPDGVVYVAARQNAGLAAAYNRALEIANEEGIDWLLTLDQDTSLPDHFLSSLEVITSSIGSDQRIAAIVPQVFDKTRMLSPSWWHWNTFPKYFPLGFIGVSHRNASAFNSASTLRVSAIRAIGGYDPRFWLDYSDAYLYRKIYKHGMYIYVAGNIQVEHEFSVLDMNRGVSLSRYQNILSAGCAFWDMELGWLAGLDYTGRLIYRTFYKHLKHGHHPAFRRASLQMLKKRLFQSRKRRIEEWEAEIKTRIS
ncbi:MAG: glycosyltransferase [Acidobacteriaceae bacterium]|jgi:GT2 family glycosyltransferase